MLEIMRKRSGALHRTINEMGEMRYDMKVLESLYSKADEIRMHSPCSSYQRMLHEPQYIPPWHVP